LDLEFAVDDTSLDFVEPQGLRVDPALDVLAALGNDELQLVEGLDALDSGFHAERFGQADDRGDDLGAVLVLLGAGINEALVDLDLVERGGAQVAERRIAGAEIVEREAHAELLEDLESRVDGF